MKPAIRYGSIVPVQSLLRPITSFLFIIALAACDGSSSVVVSTDAGAALADDIDTAVSAGNAPTNTGIDPTENTNAGNNQPPNPTGNTDAGENLPPNPTENPGAGDNQPPNPTGNTDAGDDLTPNPTEISGAEGNPPEEPVEPEPVEPQPDPFDLGSFELRLDATRFELIEANENGITVPINISRIDNHIRTVRITVAGETEQDSRRLDVQLEREELFNEETHTSWRAELGVSVGPIQFHERRFTVTADDGRMQFTQTFTVDVRPISAPDVYLLIGQSNMEGSSELGARDTSPGGLDELNPRIRQLNVRQNNRDLFNESRLFTDAGFNALEPRYITAEDPLHEPRFSFRDDKDGTFIGLGLSFAKAALPNTTTDIILVPAAWSARGFCGNDDPDLSWNAVETDEQALGGTLLADRALTRLNTALQDTGGILRGILWHQGEADSNNTVCAERYESNVISLANRIKREAFEDARGQGARGDNAPVPFILGTMTRGNDERGDFSQYSDTKQRVDNAHRNLPNILPLSDIATADDLVPPAFPCGQSSCVHFGAAAYRELGVRYYQALNRVINNNP